MASPYQTPNGRQAINQNTAPADPMQSRFGWNQSMLLDPQHAFGGSLQTQLPVGAPVPVNGMVQPALTTMENAAFGSPQMAFRNSTNQMFAAPVATPAPVTFEFMGLAAAPGHAPIHLIDEQPTLLAHMPHVTDLAQSPSPALGGADTPMNGMASLVERGFHLQDRVDVPDPKRRKVLTPDTLAKPKQTFKHSSGILADGIKSEESTDVQKPVSSTSAVTVDLTDGTDAAKTRDSYEEVCFGALHGATVDCHKLPAPKPNTPAMGGPAYWPFVKIVLRRKADDKTNTIQVYDYRRDVFGSLDARTAKVLAPLMDVANVHLRPDARIPSRRKLEDEVLGKPISRSYKIELVLYGAATFGKAVAKHLAKAGRKLVEPTRVEPGIRLAVPQVPVSILSQSAAPGVGAAPAVRPSLSTSSLSSTPSLQTRTVEEIRSEVLSVFDSMANADDLPEMEPEPIVTTAMLKHQKQALYFMVNREKPLAEQANSKLTSSIWQKKLTAARQTVFYNVITGQTSAQEPSETLGGILADMMGLGKTLSVLALVASSRNAAEEWFASTPHQPKAPERKKKPGSLSRSFDMPEQQTLGLTPLRRNGRGTLLVCPLSTITNWEEQIKQHLAPDSLRYHIYHGQNRIKDVARLSEFDLVITTYGSVSSELTGRSKRKTAEYPLEEVGWFRIVLDEAHMIREQATLQFKAICRLQASRRWAVTGTPVQNRLEDLGSLLAFLRLKPFDERSKFTFFVVNPFRACDPNILPQLRILVDTITLRRLKDKIDLPKRHDDVERLDFSPDELALYKFYNANAKDRLQVLTGRNERLMGGKTYIHILQSILRLRLICAHGRDLLSEDDLKLAQGMTLESAIDLDNDDDDDDGSATGQAKQPLTDAKAYEVFDLLTNTNADTCERCKRKLGAALETSDLSTDIRSEKQEDIVCYMTPCFHVFCPDCVKHFRDDERGISYKSGQPGVCPICQERVIFTCRALRHERADAEHDAPHHEHNGDSSLSAVTISRNSSSTKLRGSGGGTSGSSLGKTINEADYSGPHTKTKALIHDLKKIEVESAVLEAKGEPPIKSVVFSGWTSHLDLIQIALRDNGISYTRLDGRMSRQARTQAMDTFREDPQVRVILVSIMAGGLGLNLTAGSHVYVMEPQYNPAAEAQAIDRVHRLGQTREVYTKKYIMRDSFEERMRDIQNMKIKLANLSMDRSDRAVSVADAARKRLQDLQSLFK